MAGLKFVSYLGRLFCFSCNGQTSSQSPSTPCVKDSGKDLPPISPPFPCANHKETARGSCTCGLDTLGDGSLDFHKIADTILALCNKEQSQADSSKDEMEIAADFNQEEDEHRPVSIGNTRIFSYDELHEATNSFDPSQKLGDGAYGSVYRGTLKNGQTVAVKALCYDNSERLDQFMEEIFVISTLNHQNLINLQGCTSPGYKELLLVYDYMPNGTVADHLYGRKAANKSLTLALRIQIAVETAEALAYLHSTQHFPPIIHCDVKTENILLDNEFHVKVADFGLASHFRSDVAPYSLKTSAGTQGYLDPEYEKTNKLTDKSDVYSFGVVLVELLSREMAVDVTRYDVDRDEIYLVDMVFNRKQNNELDQLIDTDLGYHSDPESKRMIDSIAELAFRCLHPESRMRPRMVDVLKILKSIRDGRGLDEVNGVTNAFSPSVEGTLQTDDVSKAQISHYKRVIQQCQLFLQDIGFIDEVKQVHLVYGHSISSIILFKLFKSRQLHQDVPLHHPLASRGTSCHCRQYLKNIYNINGFAQSRCFSSFMFVFIIYFATVTHMPPHDVLRCTTRLLLLKEMGPSDHPLLTH